LTTTDNWWPSQQCNFVNTTGSLGLLHKHRGGISLYRNCVVDVDFQNSNAHSKYPLLSVVKMLLGKIAQYNKTFRSLY